MKSKRAALVACLVACAAAPAPASATGCSAGDCAWSLTNDWLAAWAGKDQYNPPSPTFADGYGNPGVWAMREGGAADAPLQGQVTGDPPFQSGQGSPDGTFDIWHGNDLGSFGANLGPNTQTYVNTVKIAGHTVTMHPDGSVPRQVDWTDPIPGTSVVSVVGGVTDDDKEGGDGIGWEIWLNSTRLASGLMPNLYDGTYAHQSFNETDAGAALASMTVNQGDQLRLIINAGPSSDPYYDTTQVDFSIFQASGGGTTGQPPTTTTPPPPAFSPTLQPIVSDGKISVPLYAGTNVEQGAKLTLTPQCANAADIQQCMVQVNGPAGAGPFSPGEPLPDGQPGDYVANVLAVNSAGTATSASFGYKVLSKSDYALQTARQSLGGAASGGGTPGQVSAGSLLNGGVNVPVAAPMPGAFAGIIAAGSGNLLGEAGGNLLGEAGGNLLGEAGGNIIAAGSGNIINAGANNLLGEAGGNLLGEAGGNIIASGAHNRAAAARTKAVVLAAGGHVFTTAGKASMRLRLAKHGRALIAAYERRTKAAKHAHRKLAPLKLAYVLYFRPTMPKSPAFYVARKIRVVG